jgi:hypothetical protein
MAHIYTSVLQALAGRGRTGRLEGGFQGYRGGAMQDLGYERPRILIPRNQVNKGNKKGRKQLCFDPSAWLLPIRPDN